MAELERLKQIKCFLFDMDGTINLGNTLIPGMDAFFKKLRSYGRDFYLVTNNSSKGHSHYVEKMRRMGIEVTRKNVLISSDAFVYYMQQVKPGASLYVLGTDLLKETIIKGGFKLTTLLEEKTDFVVVGFDMSLDYEKLAIACRLIDRGVPYVATHPDVRCPIEGGEFIPDCGAMIKLIETATGKKPIAITGKPYHYMVDVVMERTGYKKDEIAMVGDRLSTDIAFGLNNGIAFGLNNGILSVLVLTGEATLEDVEKENIHPDIILPHAADIAKYF